MNNKLTEQEEKALAYIYGYKTDFGYSPLLEEIGNHLGVTKQRARAILQQLEDKGKVVRKKNVHRGILV